MADGSGAKWTGKSRGGRAGYLFFVYMIRWTGVRGAYLLLALVVGYFIPFAPKSTKAIWIYNREIRRLGILKSVWELYMHYYTFGQTLIDKIAIKSSCGGKYNFEFDNYDSFLEVINRNQGVVVIGAHVGCWEAGVGFFGKYGKRMNVVMLDAEHAQIKEVLEESAAESNSYKVIDIGADSINALLEIKIGLNNGEYACFNGDRFLNGHTAVRHTFMGCSAQFPVGPFRIAAKCATPVIFYYALREPNRTYRFVFEEAGRVSRNGYGELMQQYIRSLERVVRRYPRQWFNFYEFWDRNS